MAVPMAGGGPLVGGQVQIEVPHTSLPPIKAGASPASDKGSIGFFGKTATLF